MMAVGDGGLRWRFAMAVCSGSMIAVCDGGLRWRFLVMMAVGDSGLR